MARRSHDHFPLLCNALPLNWTKHVQARDRALLWVLFDTGIAVAELCALRVADVDQQTGLLRVRGKGGKERLLTIGTTCQRTLRAYLRSTTRRGLERR